MSTEKITFRAKTLGAGVKVANSNKWRAGTNPYGAHEDK